MAKLIKALCVAGAGWIVVRIGYIIGAGKTVKTIEAKYGDTTTKGLFYDIISLKCGYDPVDTEAAKPEV